MISHIERNQQYKALGMSY